MRNPLRLPRSAAALLARSARPYASRAGPVAAAVVATVLSAAPVLAQTTPSDLTAYALPAELQPASLIPAIIGANKGYILAGIATSVGLTVLSAIVWMIRIRGSQTIKT